MTCPYCGGDLPPGAARCEHCGHDLLPKQEAPGAAEGPKWGLGCGLLGVLLAFLSVVILFGLLLGGLLGAPP